PQSSSPRYDYSDEDDDESRNGGDGDGPMDVDDEIDELLSDEDEGDRRGDGEDDDEDDDRDQGKGDGQRECLWEGCNEMMNDQAELVKHVQEGESHPPGRSRNLTSSAHRNWAPTLRLSLGYVLAQRAETGESTCVAHSHA